MFEYFIYVWYFICDGFILSLYIWWDRKYAKGTSAVYPEYFISRKTLKYSFELQAELAIFYMKYDFCFRDRIPDKPLFRLRYLAVIVSKMGKVGPVSSKETADNILLLIIKSEKAMAPHSSTLAWKIPWTEEPGRLQSTGLLRVGHDWASSLSLFTFMHWRRKWQLTPVFLSGESQGWGSLVGCHLWGHTELDTTEVTW